jgi:putative zinc finger protein
MSAPCASPLGWSRLVEYWAGDLDAGESGQIEEHLFGCEACSTEVSRVARTVEALRSAIPAVVTPEQILQLRARGLEVDDNFVTPGTRRQAEFRPGVDLLVHHLQGLALAHAERVEVTVRIESSGEVVFEDHFAPFDRARGEVLIACQRHFSHLPPDVAFDVRTHDSAGSVSQATFVVPHVFVG